MVVVRIWPSRLPKHSKMYNNMARNTNLHPVADPAGPVRSNQQHWSAFDHRVDYLLRPPAFPNPSEFRPVRPVPVFFSRPIPSPSFESYHLPKLTPISSIQFALNESHTPIQYLYNETFIAQKVFVKNSESPHGSFWIVVLTKSKGLKFPVRSLNTLPGQDGSAFL